MLESSKRSLCSQEVNPIPFFYICTVLVIKSTITATSSKKNVKFSPIPKKNSTKVSMPCCFVSRPV